MKHFAKDCGSVPAWKSIGGHLQKIEAYFGHTQY